MRKIRNKLMLTMLLLTLLPSLLIGAYSLYTTSEALQAHALSDQRHQLSHAQQRITQSVSTIEQDLLFLRDASAMQLYLAADSTATRHTHALLKNFSHTALQFINYQSAYHALYFLDTTGKPLVSIERDADQRHAHLLTADQQSHEHSKAAYFQQALRLASHEVYLSPIVLKSPQGELGKPPQAVIYYTTPAQDVAGNVRGVLVLALDAQHIIDHAIEAHPSNWNVYVTDPNGYYYYHPDPKKRWSGPDNLNTQHNIFDDTSLASLKSQQGVKALETATQITLLSSIHLGNGRPILGYVVSIAPKQHLFKPLQDYFSVSTILALVSLFLSAVFAMILSNSLSQPLVLLTQQVEQFSRGDLDSPIKVTASNEIGELSQAIERLRKSMSILMKRSKKAK